jgi:hypothetical protein
VNDSQTLYNNYADYLQQKYGEKVYKLPINLAGTCPNRDGVAGTGGCIFCDEEGSGFEGLPTYLSVKEQLNTNKEFFTKRFKAHKFIAYFQAFTNTYLPLESFKENIWAASELEDLVGISISTRPDCVSEDHLLFLKEVAEKKQLDVSIELGLQTVNYHTLKKINRGHTLAEFIESVLRIKKYGFEICAHIILNLPWDNETDVIENAKILSVLEIDYVKLHSLYIVKDTVLGQMYKNGEVDLIGLDEYVDRVIIFLENLRPETVIQRLVGKGPQGNLLFCNWDTSWWRIKNIIEEKMKGLSTYQGKSAKRSYYYYGE